MKALHPDTLLQPVALKVAVQPKTSIFVLQGTEENPQFTRNYVQACMEEYVNFKHDMRQKVSDNMAADLTHQLSILSTELQASQEGVVNFEGTNSFVWLQEQGNTVGAYLAKLNEKFADMKVEYSLLESLTLDQNIERLQTLAGTPEENRGNVNLTNAIHAAPPGFHPSIRGCMGTDYVRPSNKC